MSAGAFSPSHGVNDTPSPASRLLSTASFLEHTLAGWHQNSTGRTDALLSNLALWQDLLSSAAHVPHPLPRPTPSGKMIVELAIVALERTRDALETPTFQKIEHLIHLNRELAAHFCEPNRRGW